MVHIKKFRNGKPDWDVKVSTVVIGVLVLFALALITHENTAGWIAGILRK